MEMEEWEGYGKTLLLIQEYPLFEFLPFETLISKVKKNIIKPFLYPTKKVILQSS